MASFNPPKQLDYLSNPWMAPPAKLTIPKVNGVVGSCLLDKALTSLHNLIKQDAYAARISFAKQTLLQDEDQFLSTINKEKVRQSTRSVVLGKAKVMSYEDLEEAQAKRAAKEKAKEKGKATAGKGKRGRKRKNPEPETKVPKDKVARMSEVPEPVKAPESWRIPVARMY
ncbi:uncharacterized protein BDR25DRAFT_322557 [Lindgomyces ingoldianus]|uniref:Uncharacterized protein n=1 Tax=Lindgomyces ingoldianus TaxID=673940 RepID=A0ACB6R7M7_9PLEO|nr:uncharacterized protein BDR25DRAFT_322557 [Lindgomyces ingoldianus]KAF2475259.1 hypothetical protein BDR25DRAFT_322557 [Lindgomyces ingoldianus]